MPRYRDALPQLGGEIFLADGGIETDLIFNRNVEVRQFAAHTLLETGAGRQALEDYFRPYLDLAAKADLGFVLDSQTWKAHLHWAAALVATEEELRTANRDSIGFISGLRDRLGSTRRAVVLNAVIGPRGDAYAPDARHEVEAARDYHARQLGWLAETEVDMVTATTFTQADEAAGLVLAASGVGLPAAVSFTVETDGRLPSGESLADAIHRVDDLTAGVAAYFMVNCAHPDHFDHVLEDAGWARRIRGLRCNASRKSHAELDACEVLDAGDPEELANQVAAFRERLPWLNVVGGCCGTDLRHVAAMARTLPRSADPASGRSSS